MFGFGQQEPVATCDKADDKFRKDRQWLTFKGVLFSTLSGAAFTGVLIKMVNMTMDAFTGTGAGGKGIMDLLDPKAMAVVGSFMAVGAACTWIAQSIWTDVKCIEDDRLARKNAEMMKGKAPELAKAKAPVVEYEQNCRADGKQWQQVVNTQARSAVQRANA